MCMCNEYIMCNENTKIYIFGDFNLPHIEWLQCDGNTCTPNTHYCKNPMTLLVSNFLSIVGCKQFNLIKNNKNRILDLFISNNDTSTCKSPLNSLVPIDVFHPPLNAEIFFNVEYMQLARKTLPKYRFSEGKYADINDDIKRVDWASILEVPSLDTATNHFYEEIYKIIRKHVPLRPIKSKKFPIWFTRPLIHIFKNKEKSWIRWKKFSNQLDYEEYSVLRKRFKQLSAQCFNSYLSKIETSLQKDIKVFWSFVNNKKKCGIPNVMFHNGNETDNPEDICEFFSNYFTSVYENSSLMTYDIDSLPCSSNTNFIISDISFSKNTIEQCLKNLDITKSSGPDGISPFFLKHTASSISVPLFYLYNRSLREGLVPTVWKSANITPVFKNGSKTDVTNYRPISLLSALSKVLERLVHNSIYPSLHNLLIPEQHGFVKHRSTISNLILYTNFLFDNMDNRIQTDTVYTDFCKAFDKVDHSIFLQKLAFNGIRGNLLRWFSSYIINRTQKVVVNGFSSSEKLVSSGVPQGSILGPMLFTLYINDIQYCFINSNFLLYADDLKVYRSVKSLNDCEKLQEDLDRLSNYCLINKLQLSIPKCKSISFTKNRYKQTYDYKINEDSLDRKTVVKDLGVLFDSKLTFREHYAYIKNKAFQLLGFITRCTKGFKRPQSFLTVYCSLVRSILEYACVIWSPCYTVHSDSIENVQKRTLRILSYKCEFARNLVSYSELLDKFKVTTLLIRRKEYDLIYLHKILHNKVDSDYLLSKLNLTIKRNPRIPNKTFYLQTYKNNTSFYNPIVRMCRLYNEISMKSSGMDVFDPRSRTFKRAVKQYTLMHTHSHIT
ncbi:unnamed protein product [Parnassius mnemosyne]|uniref:Reverse transcriptase domain-containing protein n=1 Tax=Parnassius mnemosyne TaxID=213953 RepID=A0AAV1M7Y1_9NEOP